MTTFRCGKLTISPATRRLMRGDAEVPVEPRVLDLMILLIEERDRIVSKEELFDSVWSDVVVGSGALDRAIHEARKALGDDGARQEWIRTVRGRGYQFVGCVELEAEDHPVASRLRPLFGRDEFVTEFERAFETLVPGLRVIAIQGEAGIGKTRLAGEVGRLAEPRGIDFRVGRCSEADGAPPFWPFIQVLDLLPERQVHIEPASDIASLLGHSPRATAEVAAEQSRFWLFESIAQHLRETVLRPRVLFVDDLQWADEGSLQLLAHLAKTELEIPMVLLLTFRDEGLHEAHPIEATLARCAERVPVDRIRLGGLSHEALSALAQDVSGGATDAQQIDGLLERTGGNPFLAIETLRRPEMFASVASTSYPLARPRSKSPLPSPARGRLDLLDPTVQSLLSIASVIGRRFDVARIAAVSGRSPSQVRKELASAVRAEVIVPGMDADAVSFEFRHDLLREALYDALSEEERGALHLKIGESIEALYGNGTTGRLEELAHHFHHGAPRGKSEKAVDYSVRAGESARKQFGFEQATRHFENALSSLELEASRAQRRQAKVLLALSDTARRSGDKTRAQDALHRAADLARAIDDPGLLVEAAFALRPVLAPIEVSPCEVRDAMLLREALASVPAENHAVRARLLARLSIAFYWTPIHVIPAVRTIDQPSLDSHELEAFGWQPEISLEIAEEATREARAAADATTLAYALNAKYIAMSRVGETANRGPVASEILELTAGGDDQELRLVAEGLGLMEAVQAGRSRATARAADGLCEVADRLRHPVASWHASLARVLTAMIRGDLAAAERLAGESYQRARGDVNLAVEDCFVQQRWSIFRHQGRTAELYQEIDESGHRYRAMAHFQLMRALILVEAGQIDEARLLYEFCCADDFAEVGENMLSLFILVLLAETCFALGDRARASALYERLRPHAGRCVTVNYVSFDGPVDRVLGLLAATSGDLDGAKRHLSRAVDRMREMSARPWLDQCRADARALEESAA